jgi:hypothetical protein
VLLWPNLKGWTMTLGTAASFAAPVSLTIWCFAGLMVARLLRTEMHWRVANGILGCCWRLRSFRSGWGVSVVGSSALHN